ncbi:XVIPCD domain-containing protein [Stenotrophomonas cyclobalanopsidis]|uniref:XVIPCD domain-containing protein n=1 Tax=Stenotrophomonas cyclobalanopsidis TaxID=2771362 RepID=UPI0028A8D7CE|nr:XVIPCD domain-containing protein [Stenotrophomonas cyclobalanopsidis]
MPRKSPILQKHHVLEQQTFKNNDFLQALVEAELVEKDVFENLLYMPADKRLAAVMGVSPHGGGPIKDYQTGITLSLEQIEASSDGQAALRGDAAAMERVAARVNGLRDTMAIGLANGDLYTNAPLGMDSDAIRPRTQAFFGSIDQYAQVHAAQYGALNGMSPDERMHHLVTRTESRVVALLDAHDQSGAKLTKGSDLELQRSSLSTAIFNAQQSGRIVMSEQGILKVERVLGEEAAYRIRGPRSQQGGITLDLLIGEASASQLVRSGGLLASGADAILTTRRISEHLQQGNGTAAQSEFNHAVARSGGGWLGGMATASVIGTSSFVPAAVVAADALFMSKAFDKGADLLDNRAVYHQKDNAGVQWKFDGNNWQRQARMENSAAGPGGATEHSVGASYEKARELGAKASVSAVELALGKASPPQNPFSIPARADEGSGFGNPDWHRDAQTEQWTRVIKTGVAGANDRGIYEAQTATPERAAELNQQAVQRIEDNIAHGKAAIAASYLENRAATRASDFVPLVPDAVEAARARPDAILGSDNVLYQRDDAGTWSHQGRVAQGNMALELEATRKIQQPSIEVLDRTVAALEARPAPTNAEMNRNEVRHGYASAGISPSPQWMEAIELATARTRAQHGITGATMQQLAPAVEDNAGESRAITHYQVGADGVAHPVATTTTEELQAAWREVRERAAQQAPVPDSPELRIAALSPREQEAYQQALQEANRQGAATVDAGQAALAAAQQIQRGAPVATEADEALAEAQREQVQHRVPVPSEPVAAAVPPVAVPAPAAERETPEIARREEQRELRREPEPLRRPGPQQAEAQERGREVADAPAARAARTLHEPPADIAVAPNDAPHHAHAQNAEEARTHDSHQSEPPRMPPAAPEPQPQPTPVPAVEHALEEPSIPPAAPVHEAIAEAPVAQNRAAEPVAERPAETAQHNNAVPSIAAAEEEATTRAEPRTDTQAATPPPADAVFGPAQPGHPDHALYQQVRQGIEALDAKHGRNFDHTSERMVASLTVLAKDNDLERVDHVLVSKATAEHPAGHALFLVQGEPADPAHHRASMPTEAAAQTSVEESAQQFDVVSREAQQRAVANQMEQQLEDQRVQHEIQIRAASGGY